MTPHIVGAAIVGTLIAICLLFPHSEWTQALLTTYRFRATGPDGGMRRVDHVRGAVIGFLLCALFVVASFGFAGWSEKYPGLSRMNWTLSAYMFGFFLLSGVSLLCAVGEVWRAVRWRPPVIET